MDQQFEKVDREQRVKELQKGRNEELAVSGFLLFSWKLTNWLERPDRNE